MTGGETEEDGAGAKPPGPPESKVSFMSRLREMPVKARISAVAAFVLAVLMFSTIFMMFGGSDEQAGLGTGASSVGVPEGIPIPAPTSSVVEAMREAQENERAQASLESGRSFIGSPLQEPTPEPLPTPMPMPGAASPPEGSLRDRLNRANTGGSAVVYAPDDRASGSRSGPTFNQPRGGYGGGGVQVAMNEEAIRSAILALKTEITLEDGAGALQVNNFAQQAADQRGLDGVNSQAPADVQAAQAVVPTPRPALAPGDTLVAALRYGINTDRLPAVVVADVISGPHRGSVLFGQATRTDVGVPVRFTSMTRGDETLPVDAVAIDVEYNELMLRGDVDRHLVSKVLALAFAGAGEGVLGLLERSAGQQSGGQAGTGAIVLRSVSPTERDLVIGAVGGVSRLGLSLLQPIINRPTTVEIPEANLLGVMFLQPVSATWLPMREPMEGGRYER